MSVQATALLFSAFGLILYTGARIGLWAPRSTAALAALMGPAGKIEAVALLGWIAGSLAAACLLLVSGGCGRGGEAARRAPEGDRTAAGPGPSAPAAQGPEAGTAAPAATAGRQEGFLGVLLAREAVDVAAEAAGRITAVQVRVGDPVARGALLATLDTQLMRQDLGAAREVLHQAQIEEEKSRIALVDAEGRLRRRKSIPEAFPREEIIAAENQVAAARAALEGAQARVREQQARVSQAATALARAEVRAPFAGTVAVRYLDPGATVGAGEPIVRLVDAGDLMVRFAVPEGETRAVRVGQPVRVRHADSGTEMRAVVEKIAPQVDPASNMVFAEARLEGAAGARGALQAGSVVRVLPQAPAAAGG